MSARRTRILWILSPFAKLDHPRDTSLRLVQTAASLGLECSIAEPAGISWHGDRVVIAARRVLKVGSERRKTDFSFGPPKLTDARRFARIVYRVDPPFDLLYQHPLRILAAGAAPGHVVNDPSLLLTCSSKIAPLTVEQGRLPALVSSDRDLLQDFVRRNRTCILKPIGDGGGRGVYRLHWSAADGGRSAMQRIARATSRFRVPVILQKYRDGRLWRAWYLGGQCVATGLIGPSYAVSAYRPRGRALRLVEAMGASLRRDGFLLAAADMIDTMLLEINFASPGLLVEFEEAYRTNFADRIVRAIAGDQAPRI